MGEYARQQILERHGVDIGDDDHRPVKPWIPCRKCGRHFRSEQAVADHQRDYHKIVKEQG